MNFSFGRTILLVCWVLSAMIVRGGEFYVSPSGNDLNLGTLESPFASLARGQQAATAGDTVWIRGGEYHFSGTTQSIGVLFDKSGTANNPIKYWAYPGETPAFDFFDLLPQDRVRGFSVRADWLHFRGLEVRGVQQILTNVNESWGIRVENGADHNIFERLDLHHNEGPGLFIADGGNNLVLNSDSHHNYDPDRGGENADGFGSHSNDPGNMFIGDRAWSNSDDGFDFINSSGVAMVKDSWSWRNGFIPGTNTGAGNGAGIKAGGFGLDPGTFPAVIPRHEIIGNLTFENRSQGIYANHHPGGLDFINNTALNNPRNFDMLADVGAADHLLRNNVAFGTGQALARATLSEIDTAFNTWDGGVTVTNADFQSLSTLGVDGARQADGSLPVLGFMRLSPGSDLEDAGEYRDLPFNGIAPDLGAFETVEPSADFDGDGDVDGRDFLVWQRGFNNGTTRGQGDANGDLVVNAADLAIWQEQFASLPLSAAVAVPEPSTAALFACLCGLAIRRVAARRFTGLRLLQASVTRPLRASVIRPLRGAMA